MKTFQNLEEIKQYYNENTNTYEFVENEQWLDVELNFNLSVDSNILAGNISAGDIDARDIIAGNIIARDISTDDLAGGLFLCNIYEYHHKKSKIIYFEYSYYSDIM